MPEWLWSVVVGVVLVGLLVALRNADRERISKLEQWIKDKEKFDHDWRHDEYNPEISEIALKVRTLETKVDRIERVLNGHLKDER